MLVQERTFNLLKNLVAGSTESHTAVALWAADEGNPDSGPAKLIAALAAPLLPDAGATDNQAHHALLAISNLCTGTLHRTYLSMQNSTIGTPYCIFSLQNPRLAKPIALISLGKPAESAHRLCGPFR